MKDTIFASEKQVNKKWHLIDAEGQTLGRLATKVVENLNGKKKVYYTQSQNMGDYVIVINANKINVTGNKSLQKKYLRHSGRPGGLKVKTYMQMSEENPSYILQKAVKGMLPKNSLGRKMLKNLKIYTGKEYIQKSQRIESN